MNKRLKKKYAFNIFVEKYRNMGRIARKKVKNYMVEGKTVNYIEYDNVGLEFFMDEKRTYIRDIKGNADFENCFQDYFKALLVLQGFYKRKNRDK
ncbi:hypothetical protein CLTEP_05530 [Clostridium tepidiprofundi DSM 19306]|uniref:Uncharacterized protein n=1 Tax=Clostridium tepidiprofundi DSM 19306 TaxID=1121338 RepID=A0A151B6V6_9CLOT|nr:hypothetical protein [Clostridium tepidiprofundi]KYH35377.1 hypothetical protein CLTEP_05530 [Clostridium tepidiprofundi DSM 19306]